MIPAFQRIKQKANVETIARDVFGLVKDFSRRSMMTARPRIKIRVRETKKRLPKDEMPAQSG